MMKVFLTILLFENILFELSYTILSVSFSLNRSLNSFNFKHPIQLDKIYFWSK